jgi:hypothetical protein
MRSLLEFIKLLIEKTENVILDKLVRVSQSVGEVIPKKV